MIPDDSVLTDQGLAPERNSGRVLVLACGALAREILALIDLNDWHHMALQCLPANLHLYPDKIPDAVEAAVRKARPNYDDIFVAYADCGTGGLLQQRCKDLGVKMIAGPHCYSFFEGNAQFSSHIDNEFTAFYLTDFLVRQFDAFVWKPMGFARHPELIDMMFGNYEKLVYLAQTEDSALTEKARESADRLNLKFERRSTGYGDLQTSLATL